MSPEIHSEAATHSVPDIDTPLTQLREASPIKKWQQRWVDPALQKTGLHIEKAMAGDPSAGEIGLVIVEEIWRMHSKVARILNTPSPIGIAAWTRNPKRLSLYLPATTAARAKSIEYYFENETKLEASVVNVGMILKFIPTLEESGSFEARFQEKCLKEEQSPIGVFTENLEAEARQIYGDQYFEQMLDLPSSLSPSHTTREMLEGTDQYRKGLLRSAILTLKYPMAS